VQKRAGRQWFQSKLKGKLYVLDNCGNTNGSVVARTVGQLHDGRVNPYPAGGRCGHGAVQVDSGATIGVMGGNEERGSHGNKSQTY
jgi:hypothetical protein